MAAFTFFVSRSRSVARCAHIQAFTLKTLSRSRSVACGAVVCGVWCVVWVHEGVVLCDELCVVLFGVLRGGGVVVWVFYFSLSLSFSFSLSFLFFPSSVLSSSFISLFFLFLFSLPFSPTNTVKSTDQQT